MAEAMRRDLGLTDRQLADRLRVEAAAAVVDKRLRAGLGTRYAGSWLAAGDRLTVAVTDESVADAVRAEGPNPASSPGAWPRSPPPTTPSTGTPPVTARPTRYGAGTPTSPTTASW